MSQAVIKHNNGEYESAFELNQQAYSLASDGSSEQGRAARDSAAQLDRLGRLDDAVNWAQTAYEIHRALFSAIPNPGRLGYRELAATELYVGAIGLRQAIKLERAARQHTPHIAESETALEHLREVWNHLAVSQILRGADQQPDQYQINAVRRVSMAESLYGDRKTGFKLGTRAVKLAFISESQKLDTASPNFSKAQRCKAKVKALAGGVMALTINSLASPELNRRRKIALRIADYAL